MAVHSLIDVEPTVWQTKPLIVLREIKKSIKACVKLTVDFVKVQLGRTLKNCPEFLA
jgi:hypothetical protein